MRLPRTPQAPIDVAAAAVGVSVPRMKSWARAGLIDLGPQGTVDVSRLAELFPSEARKTGGPKARGSAPTVVSFFSGCGGLDFGFRAAGFELAFANDFFVDAARTYFENIGPIDPRSIEQVSIADAGKGDVLLAGFPCQPFSNAGNRKGISDPRGTLFWETLRFVEALKPKVVVFENVKGLLSMRNPSGKLLIEDILAELVTRGYVANFALLNAANYGVPQNRHRVVIIGVRRSHSTKAFDFAAIEQEPGVPIAKALARIPRNAPNQEHWELSPQAQLLERHIPEGGSWKSVPYAVLPLRLQRIRDDMARYHSPNFYRRFSRDEIMGTVTAAATPENSGILHPTEPRRFMVRELARFQTFPDDFVFYGTSVAAKYKQLGNAVPPELARRIASAIMIQYFK